jgi:Spy/CpxP family protein refolding chaperone
MTQKTKTFFIISVTFIIGIVLGTTLSSTIHQRRMDDIRRMNYQQRFDELIQRIIKPTAEQQKVIKEIIQKRSTQIESLREKQHQDLLGLFDSLRVELNSALTDEQRELLELEMEKGVHRRFDWRIDQMAQELNLTEAQQEKMKELFSKSAPQMNFRRGPDFPGGMPPEGRREDFPNRMEKMREMEQKIEKILTPEQLEKYKNTRGRGPFGPEKPFGPPGNRPEPPFFRENDH